MTDFRAEIDEIRAVESSDSIELLIQIVLLGSAAILAWMVVGLWQVFLWFCVTYGLVAFEKWLHWRCDQPYSKTLYVQYLALGALIALSANTLPVFLWTQDGMISKYAAMVFSVGALLNTFLVRAKVWPVLLCYVVPNALSMCAIAGLIIADEGDSAVVGLAIVLGAYISVYLVVCVAEAVKRTVKERKTVEDLYQAQKTETLGNLAGGIAHDFNNLLAVVSANLDLLRDSEDERDRRRLIDQAQLAIDRGSSLTRQLLAVGRRSALSIEDIAMAPFLEELQALLQRVMPEHIQIRIAHDPHLKRLATDRSVLQSTLINLAVNAREAMPTGGILEIAACLHDVPSGGKAVMNARLDPGRYAEISVRDTGKGIAADVFGHVLEPFFTTRANYEGSGLGLAMVDGYSRQAGGGVDIQTEVNVGTTVSFYLPFRERSATEAKTPLKRPDRAAPDLGPARSRGVTPLRVLLVEDEHPLRAVLARHLTSTGYALREADSGDAALAVIEEGFVPDIVLTDIVMPGQIQGSDLIRVLRPRFPSTVYVMMTGYNFAQDTPPGLGKPEPGQSVSTLSKPFRLKDLDDHFARVLSDPEPCPSLARSG